MLEYPNHEVRLSFNKQLLVAVSGNFSEVERRGKNMVRFLADNDFEEFGAELSSFSQTSRTSGMSRTACNTMRAFMRAWCMACFTAIGVDVKGEESTSLGRSDLVVVLAGEVFVMEFKVAKQPADQAKVEAEAMDSIAQIRENEYAGKYRHRRGKIHLLGVVFNEEKHNVATIRVERD